MKKPKFSSRSNPGFVILSLLILLTTACVKQEASKVERPNPANPLLTSSTDAEISAAQKIIEKSPNTAKGYNLLAARYIRLARETGDFSINTTAETAVNRSHFTLSRRRTDTAVGAAATILKASTASPQKFSLRS